MQKRAFPAACAALLFGVVAVARAQPPTAEADLEEFKEFLINTADDNMRNPEAHDLNGFRVLTSDNAELGADFRPNGNRFQLLEIASPGVFRTMVEKGRPSSQGGSTGVYHRDSGQPMLGTWDADGDGRLDGVQYWTMDENGKARLTVIDYEADGQLDLRMHFDEVYTEIWHIDRWHRIEKRGNQRGVMLDGEFVELERQDNRLVVPQR
ncbi:MAG TPA: hypothetical protein VLI71_07125 [Gammaproteobacteria bacterium]|nr:hypothetical protein [Gammaproteobacteria bacterium]